MWIMLVYWAMLAAFIAVAGLIASKVLGLKRVLRGVSFGLLLVGAMVATFATLALATGPRGWGSLTADLKVPGSGAALIAAAVVLDRVLAREPPHPRPPEGFEVKLTAPPRDQP